MDLKDVKLLFDPGIVIYLKRKILRISEFHFGGAGAVELTSVDLT